jgi:hypothetical protein
MSGKNSERRTVKIATAQNGTERARLDPTYSHVIPTAIVCVVGFKIPRKLRGRVSQNQSVPAHPVITPKRTPLSNAPLHPSTRLKSIQKKRDSPGSESHHSAGTTIPTAVQKAEAPAYTPVTSVRQVICFPVRT